MASEQVVTRDARQTVLVDTFTNGLLGPDIPLLGPVTDGGHIVWNSTPGCWGPMITPAIRGGHEVSHPVAIRRTLQCANCNSRGRGRLADQSCNLEATLVRGAAGRSAPLAEDVQRE